MNHQPEIPLLLIFSKSFVSKIFSPKRSLENIYLLSTDLSLSIKSSATNQKTTQINDLILGRFVFVTWQVNRIHRNACAISKGFSKNYCLRSYLSAWVWVEIQLSLIFFNAHALKVWKFNGEKLFLLSVKYFGTSEQLEERKIVGLLSFSKCVAYMFRVGNLNFKILVLSRLPSGICSNSTGNDCPFVILRDLIICSSVKFYY